MGHLLGPDGVPEQRGVEPSAPPRPAGHRSVFLPPRPDQLPEVTGQDIIELAEAVAAQGRALAAVRELEAWAEVSPDLAGPLKLITGTSPSWPRLCHMVLKSIPQLVQ